MGLGILDPTVVQNQIQSQLLLNTLLANNASNPLLNRLSFGGQTSLLNRTVPKPKDDIEITVRNDLKVNSGSKCMTKPQIRRQVTNDGSQSSTDCEIIDMPSMPTKPKPKPQLSTLFSKHLQNKANQSKEKQSSDLMTHSSSSFGEALAEVEVGVDNDYLQKLEQQKRKREEWLQQKERNRLQMADERLESAINAKKMMAKY